jgi:ferredoxin
MGEVDGRRKAKAASPFACMVGCSTCANICPTHAISFPDPSIVLGVEREHKIFSVVHKEADARREKQRSKALETCECIKRQSFEIAGEVGRLCNIEELREIVLPFECDIVEFSISIPSIAQHKKGAPGVAKMTLIGRNIEEASALLSDKIVAKELVIVKK